MAGGDVDVHAQIATAPVDANSAVGKDGAIEGVVAKAADVVGKEIVGGNLEVVAQTGEMLVMDESVDIAGIAVGIADDGILELYLVGDEGDGVVVEGVAAVERTNHRRTVDDELAGEVDGAERTGKANLAHGATVDLADERLGERVHEVDVGGVGLDAEVDIVALGRHVALDDGACVVAVVGDGVDVYLTLLLVPVDIRAQHSHAPALEEEVAHGEVGMCRHIPEGSHNECLARGTAVEIHGMEIDKVENVAHVDAVEVDVQRVALAGACRAVDDDVLAIVGDGELADVDVLGRVVDVGRLDKPCLVADGEVGGLHNYMGIGDSLTVLAKGRGGIETTSALALVEPAERHVNEVVGGIAAGGEVEDVAIVLMLLHLGGADETVGMGMEIDVGMAEGGTVVDEEWSLTFDHHRLAGVGHIGAKKQRATYIKRDTQQGAHPLGGVEMGDEGEVVVALVVLVLGRYHGDVPAYLRRDARHERRIIEMAREHGIAEVALHDEVVLVGVETAAHLKIVDRTGVGG